MAGRQAMKKVSANTPHNGISSADTPEQRSKNIAAKLRQQRRERDGAVLGDSQSSRMPRRPGESTADRNQRIITRYLELLEQRGGKPRGIPVQLGREFKVSPQYIRAVVIAPFINFKTTNKRR